MQVGWSVAGPGETHGFIPEEIEGTLEKHDQEISSKLDRPDPGAMIAMLTCFKSKGHLKFHLPQFRTLSLTIGLLFIAA